MKANLYIGGFQLVQDDAHPLYDYFATWGMWYERSGNLFPPWGSARARGCAGRATPDPTRAQVETPLSGPGYDSKTRGLLGQKKKTTS